MHRVIFDREFRFRIENCIKKRFKHEKIESENFRFFARKKSIFRKRENFVKSRFWAVPIVKAVGYKVIFDRDFRFRIENCIKKSI